MIPATTKHLVLNPTPLVDEAASDLAHEGMGRYAAAPAGVVEQRLRELDREWDVERLTAITFGLVVLGGVLLVAFLGPGWLVLLALGGACLLLHGAAGWSPALLLTRCLGYRTAREIAQERFALRATCGDIPTLSPDITPEDREDLSRFENEGGAPAGTQDANS